jgi:hypothetical protein
MLAQRALIRSARRLPRQLPTKRSYASQDANLHGAQDNAFNRERAAVKHHAEQTSSIAFPVPHTIASHITPRLCVICR